MPENKNIIDLTTIITTAIKVPGVKVSRHDFLQEQFKDCDTATLSKIIEVGPVKAGCSRTELKKKAQKLIKECTAFSTSASFLAGLPGGIAMAATISADMIQFYGVALRMAQQLVYLYGEEDMWCEDASDPDKITNQLILYCGVMLGSTGASQTVRVMSSTLEKQALKKLPQKALTKTFYYPIIKSILKFFSVQITKNTFAKGVSKVIPVVGGFVSSGITLASMLPMGNRLLNTLDEAHFDYDEFDMDADIEIINTVCEEVMQEEILPCIGEPITDNEETTQEANTKNDIFDQIKQAKEMLDNGILTEEEFAAIKAKLISQL